MSHPEWWFSVGRRMFIAVWLPDDIRDQLSEMVDGLRQGHEGVRWLPPESYHVTLSFLGTVKGEARFLMQALNALDLSPVAATIGPEVRMLGRNVLCAPVTGLDDLATMVREATADLAAQPPDHPFTGHITLARLGNRRHGRRRRSSLGFVREWVGTPVSGEWTVDELSLMHSRRNEVGTVYDELYRRSLPHPGPDDDYPDG